MINKLIDYLNTIFQSSEVLKIIEIELDTLYIEYSTSEII